MIISIVVNIICIIKISSSYIIIITLLIFIGGNLIILFVVTTKVSVLMNTSSMFLRTSLMNYLVINPEPSNRIIVSFNSKNIGKADNTDFRIEQNLKDTFSPTTSCM